MAQITFFYITQFTNILAFSLQLRKMAASAKIQVFFERSFSTQSLHSNQRGQSLVEYALLLLVITTISFAFMSFTNQSLGKYWMYFTRLIVDDPTQNATLTID